MGKIARAGASPVRRTIPQLEHTRNSVSKLRIPPVSFDALMTAVVRVKPPPKPPRGPKPDAKKPGRRKRADPDKTQS